MAFTLTDDGTMDTIVRCEYCGQEERFNYDPPPEADDSEQDDEELYAEWIDECCANADDDHECSRQPEPDAEPEPDPLT